MGERETKEENEKLYLTKVSEIEEETEVSKVRNKKRDWGKNQACHPRGKRRKIWKEENLEENEKIMPGGRKRKHQDIQEEEEGGEKKTTNLVTQTGKNQHQGTKNWNEMKASSDKITINSSLFKKMKQPAVKFKQNHLNAKNGPSNENNLISGVNQGGKISQAKSETKLTPSPDVPNSSLLLATQHHPIPPPPIKPRRKKGLELPKHFNCKSINDHFKPVRSSPTNLTSGK